MLGQLRMTTSISVTSVLSRFRVSLGMIVVLRRGKFDIAFGRDVLCISNPKTNLLVPASLVTHVAVGVAPVQAVIPPRGTACTYE